MSRRVFMRREKFTASCNRLLTNLWEAGGCERLGSSYSVERIIPLKIAIQRVKVSAKHFRQAFGCLGQSAVWLSDWLRGLGNLFLGRVAFRRVESPQSQQWHSC